MPVLDAREQLAMINGVAAGVGRLTPEDHRSHLAYLQRAANHGTTPRSRVVRLKSPAAIAAALGQMGVDATAEVES